MSLTRDKKFKLHNIKIIMTTIIGNKPTFIFDGKTRVPMGYAAYDYSNWIEISDYWLTDEDG